MTRGWREVALGVRGGDGGSVRRFLGHFDRLTLALADAGVVKGTSDPRDPWGSAEDPLCPVIHVVKCSLLVLGSWLSVSVSLTPEAPEKNLLRFSEA